MMTQKYLFRCWCVAIATLVFSAQCCLAADCTRVQQQATALAKNIHGKTVSAQFYLYLQFLSDLTDDPEDCASSDTRAHIADLEKKLLTLKAAGHVYSSNTILHCNEVEAPAQQCRGTELDGSLFLGEKNSQAFKQAQLRPDSGKMTLQLGGLDAKVVGVFAGEHSELLTGHAPTPIPFHHGTLLAQSLHPWTNPVLIVILHRNDILGFRKCVWLFR